MWELYQDLIVINGNRDMFYFINSVEPEQLVSVETSCSGSTLFSIQPYNGVMVID